MDESLQELYTWVDEVPLSRTKRNIARDFSDGVLMAEVVAHFYPKLVELHNYSAANSMQQKNYNWQTLNKKVLRKLQLPLTVADVEDVVNCVPGAVEQVLKRIKAKVERDKYGVNSGGSGGSVRNYPGMQPQYADPDTSRSGRGDQRMKPVQQHQQAQPQPPQQHMSRMDNYPIPSSSGRGSESSYQYQASSLYDQTAMQAEVDTEILVEKEQMIHELKETIEILETKVKKLEQLVRLKDTKIQSLTTKLQQLQGGPSPANVGIMQHPRS